MTTGDPKPSPATTFPTGCPFCERIENLDYLAEARGCVSFEPLNPVTPGHLLVVPRQHVVHAAAEPWVTANVFEVAADLASRGSRKVVPGFGTPQTFSYNLITSIGEAATQTVQHLHVHLVPRWRDDGLRLPWTGQERRSKRPCATPGCTRTAYGDSRLYCASCAI